tara:strand:+ start:194 stop:631 length:438 start_codon:yes stop_codon:yes gene_type:complete
MAKKDILVYTTKECSYCKSIKDTLDKENIKYTELPTSEEGNKKAWYDITNTTGMPTVPTVIFKDEIFVAGRDFQTPDVLIQIINNYQKPSCTDTELTYQRLRTLNYGIQTSMQRLDGLLKTIESKITTIEKNYRELFEDEETKTE